MIPNDSPEGGATNQVGMKAHAPSEHVFTQLYVVINGDDLSGCDTDEVPVLKIQGLSSVSHVIPAVVLEHDRVEIRPDPHFSRILVDQFAKVEHRDERMVCGTDVQESTEIGDGLQMDDVIHIRYRLNG
jgi:hypothetical protein